MPTSTTVIGADTTATIAVALKFWNPLAIPMLNMYIARIEIVATRNAYSHP